MPRATKWREKEEPLIIQHNTQELTLSEYIAYWLVNFKKNSIKPATYERLVISFEQIKQYRIADLKIKDIYPQHIQSYLNELVSDGYALTTIKKQMHIVTAPLRHAAAARELPNDPTIDVTLPARENILKPEKDVEAYTEAQQERLNEVLSTINNQYANAVKLMIETGMRIGEVIALDWDDIDWRRKSINVRKTMIDPCSVKRCRVQNSPKTRQSNRVIPMSTKCYEMLKEAYDLHLSSHVITGHDGGRMSYRAFVKHTKTFCQKADIPYKGTHVFRHTFATNCFYRGCNVKLLSKLLGHSSPAVTYSIYINLFGDALEEMRSVLE